MQNRVVLVVLTIAMCTAFAQDAMCVDIVYPPAEIDSNTTFSAVIDAKNNGSELLPNVPLSFNIVRASEPTDTIFYDTANSGQIGAGETKRITFAGSCTPEPGYFTMTCITELPGDTNRHNDTCTKSLFVIYVDVALEFVSPTGSEPPGPVLVVVLLTNLSDVLALVPRLDVVVPNYPGDYVQNIAIGVGTSQRFRMCDSWNYLGGRDTLRAWITYPDDMNQTNDTAIVIMGGGGILDRVESEPRTGMRMTLSPSPLAGNILRVEYNLNQAGPATVTFSDIMGRVVVRRGIAGNRRGEISLDLRRLSGGVYFVRLDDGRSAITQKLVIQR
jgi:hypothetical protein